MANFHNADRDYWTLKAMSKFGGGFVKILAELAHHADPINFAIIKTSWPHYWAEYEATGRTLEKQHIEKHGESTKGISSND